LFDARAIEELADDTGPRFDVSLGARGGTSLLRDQSVCPFRAFAHHRLAATALAEPQAGLSPMERGLIAHGVLAVVWGELNDRNGLRSCDAARLHEIVTAATRRAIADELRGRPHPGRIFVQMEETRVADLVLRWLAIEQARTAEFRVIEREATHSMTIGELTIKGRMDRVDEFADGSRLIIDYKTGKASAARWMGERPDEPQLPAYVCFGSIGPVAGVAFGLLNRAESAFVGIARDEGLVPGVKPPGAGNETAGGAAWDETVASWRRAIEAIAAGFLSGDARVDPKTGTICKTCDLHMFCRIHEHPAGDDAMEGDDGEG
jgi:probable DNA repair protein